MGLSSRADLSGIYGIFARDAEERGIKTENHGEINNGVCDS